MRKQSLIVIVLAVAMAAFFAVGCNFATGVTDSIKLTLDTTKVKTQFFIDEEFTADGLVVKASVDYANMTHKDLVLKQNEYDITTDFDSTKAGTYEVKVEYANKNLSATATYQVTVSERKYEGISVKLAEGVEDSIHLTSEPAVIDTTKIVVAETDSFGNLLDTKVTGYTTTLYKGKTPVELTDGKASVTEDGAYQIWVEKPSKYVEGYVVKAFVTVYVVDNAVALEWNKTAEGTVTTQQQGLDAMSETWQFVVTYESGKTKAVAADKVVFETEIDTNTVGEQSVMATYTEANVKGEKVTTEPATVTYTITAKPVVGGEEVKVSANISDLESKDYTESFALAEGITALAAADKKLTVDGNSKTLDGVTYTKRLKFNGKGTTQERSLKLEPQGAGTVTILLITGSSSALDRTMSFTDATGTELGNTGGIPNAITRYTFEFTQAGTYYLVPNAAVNMYYIEMAYTVPQKDVTVSANISDLESKDYTESFALAEGVTALAAADKKLTVDGNSKTLDGVTYTKRLKFNGKGTTQERSLKLEPQGAGTVTILLITGSSSALDRTMSFTDATGAELGNTGGIPNAITRYTFEFTKAGTYYLVPSAAVNMYYIEMTYTPSNPTPETVTDSYEFNIPALQEAIKTRMGVTEVADRTQLEASDFGGVNEFITFNGVGKSSDQYRTSKNGCIEIKGATLTVTFKGTGTLTVSFASTGSTNKSRIAVANAAGTRLAGQTTATAIIEGDEAGSYEVTGTDFVTVVYEITEPGTYTIMSPSVVTTRGARIQTIAVSDTH